MKINIYIVLTLITGLLFFFLLGTPSDRHKDLWIFVTAVATVLLWLVAAQELGGVNKVARSDFGRRFSAEFFHEDTRDLVMLLDYNCLKLEVKSIEYEKDSPGAESDFPYFEIRKDILGQLPLSGEKKKSLQSKGVYTSFEVDDFVLGFFEEIGALERKGMLDIVDVYNNFDWYIDTVWNNSEIQAYMRLETTGDENGEDIGEDFKYIKAKCDSYGIAKLGRKPIWWWKLKWKICHMQAVNRLL